ncbi:MAG: hypothetical protein WA192_09860 [Candidatus Acidiferrales bacterium]
MREAFLGGCVVLLLAALAWASGDPWKSKPYQQWDAKDVRKVLESSPWVKAVQINAPWKAAQASGAGADSDGATAPGSPIGRSTEGARPAPGGSSDLGSQGATATFLVTWASSRTVREALVRNAILSGRMKEEQAEPELAHPVTSYEIVITGADMKPFQSVDEKILEDAAFLIDRKEKERIPAAGVQIQRSEDGAKIVSVVFSFPKRASDGTSTVPADEKNLDFSCIVTNVKIQASFDTSKMMDSQGRDL